MYEAYWDMEEVQKGLKSQTLIQVCSYSGYIVSRYLQVKVVHLGYDWIILLYIVHVYSSCSRKDCSGL